MRFSAILLAVLISVSAFAQPTVTGPSAGVFNVPVASGGSGITNTTSGLTNWFKLDENTGTTTVDSMRSINANLNNSGGVIPTWVPGQINSALSFDGVGGYVQMGTNTVTGPLTISAWVYMTNGQNGTIIYDSDNDSTHGWFLWVTNAASINVRVAATTTDLERSGAAVIPTNAWFHILATWDGVITTASSFHIYTNGVEVGSYLRSVNGAGTIAANTTTGRLIGYGSTGAAFKWAGKIDDVRVWNRVLNAGEIANMYAWKGQP